MRGAEARYVFCDKLVHWLGAELLAGKDKVVFELDLGLRVVFEWLEVADEVGLHGKDGVVAGDGVFAVEELGDDGAVLGRCDHHVDVGGTHGVAVEGTEKLACWACWGEY